MRVNKYKISKKRRLRRRGKYSKKLKTKSRKVGGWPSYIRGHVKNNVKIRATCKIPEFFFDLHNLFYEIMGMSPPVEQTKYPDAGIDISVYGKLLEKKLLEKTDSSTLVELKLNIESAVISDVYFNIQSGYDKLDMRSSSRSEEEKKLNLDATGSRIFTVEKISDTYSHLGVQYSEYKSIANPNDFFVYKDMDERILKLLLHLWRKKYNPIISSSHRDFKNFDDFFQELSTKYSNIVKWFREHIYSFEVGTIMLSSS